jgi:hypothetical protein
MARSMICDCLQAVTGWVAPATTHLAPCRRECQQERTATRKVRAGDRAARAAAGSRPYGLTTPWHRASATSPGPQDSPRPAMDRSEHRPRERRSAVNGIATVDRDTSALEKRLDDLDVRSVLPLALEVEVGTGGDQHLEHRRLFRGDVRGTLAEREHRRVDLFLDMRQSEQSADGRDLKARHRITERLDEAGSPSLASRSRSLASLCWCSRLVGTREC